MLVKQIVAAISAAIVVIAHETDFKQLCCPQTVMKDYIDTAEMTNLMTTSFDSEGNLVCWYEGVGFHGLEEPFCKYTPIERQRLVHKSSVTIPAGRSLGGGELGCDGFAPERQPGKGPCTSNVCCPDETTDAMKLQDSRFSTFGKKDTIKCSYELVTCEYDLDGTAVGSDIPVSCKDADTDRMCIIQP